MTADTGILTCSTNRRRRRIVRPHSPTTSVQMAKQITATTAALEKSTASLKSDMVSQHQISRISLNQMEYNRIFAPSNLENIHPLSLEKSQPLSLEDSQPLNSESSRPICRQRTTEQSGFFSEEMEDMLTLKRAKPVFDESDDESFFVPPTKRQRTNSDAIQTISWSDRLREDDELEEFVHSQ